MDVEVKKDEWWFCGWKLRIHFMYLHKNKEPKKGIELIHVKLPTNFSKKQQKNTKMKIRMWRRNGKTSSFKLKRVHFCYPSSSSSILFGFSSFLFFIWIINDIIYLSVKCFFLNHFMILTLQYPQTWHDGKFTYFINILHWKT